MMVSVIVVFHPFVDYRVRKFGLAASSSVADPELLEVFLRTGLNRAGTELSSLNFFRLYLVPTLLGFPLLFFWWPSIYEFYKSRQPWIGLKKAQPSRFNLTLDYHQVYLPAIDAIQKRHWAVAILALGILINICVPGQLAILFSAEWRSFSELHKVTRTYAWNDHIQPLPTEQRFNLALRSLLESRSSRLALSEWAIRDPAFVPVDLSFANKTGPMVLEYENESRQASVECDEATVHLKTIPQMSPQGRPLIKIEELEISQSNETDSLRARLGRPCSSVATKNPRLGRSLSGLPDDTVCSRWWFDNGSEAESDTMRWFIAALVGPAVRSSNNTELLFTSDPTRVGLICKLVITKDTSTTQVYLKARNSYPIQMNYTPNHQQILDDQLAMNISRGLNRSVSKLDGAGGGVYARHPIISTEAFVGDILAYTWYRRIYLYEEFTVKAGDLMLGAADLFSAYCTLLWQQPDMLKSSTATDIEVKLTQWQKRLIVNRNAAYFLLAMWALYAAVLVKLGVARKKYFLPLAPELLPNSLALLCRSGIVDKMEQHIPELEMLSQSEFHRKVEDWGLEYKLGVIEVAGLTEFVVDNATAFEDDLSNDPHRESFHDEEHAADSRMPADLEQRVEDLEDPDQSLVSQPLRRSPSAHHQGITGAENDTAHHVHDMPNLQHPEVQSARRLGRNSQHHVTPAENSVGLSQEETASITSANSASSMDSLLR